MKNYICGYEVTPLSLQHIRVLLVERRKTYIRDDHTKLNTEILSADAWGISGPVSNAQ